DDWGGWSSATNAIHECVKAGRVSSVSAMVFMEDSARASALAASSAIDAGLHLNFNQTFSDSGCPKDLKHHQARITAFFNLNRYAQVLYHPLLHRSFQMLVREQLAEFKRLYRRPPTHIDGHRHLHLSSNVILRGLLPAGIPVRRSFSFFPGEK